MPDLLAFIQKVCAHDLGLVTILFFEQVVLKTDLMRASRSIKRRLFFADRMIVDDDVIESDLRRVPLDDLKMLARRIAVRLSGLRHQVADENTDGARAADHVCDARHQQVRENARVERAWTNGDEVCGTNGRQSF